MFIQITSCDVDKHYHHDLIFKVLPKLATNLCHPTYPSKACKGVSFQSCPPWRHFPLNTCLLKRYSPDQTLLHPVPGAAAHALPLLTSGQKGKVEAYAKDTGALEQAGPGSRQRQITEGGGSISVWGILRHQEQIASEIQCLGWCIFTDGPINSWPFSFSSG